MFKKYITLALGFTFLLTAGCGDNNPFSSDSSQDIQVSGDWLIPKNQIRDGGPGKDGIPAIQNPEMIPANNANYLQDNDLVVGVQYLANDNRAYPHIILDWHEIINETVAGKPHSITFCPLTGSGIGWRADLAGQSTTYGVSGLLYNSNLIPYDRATDSNWSQMKLQCVEGTLKGQDADLLKVVETTWGTWKEMYPDSKVPSTNTGFSRPYGSSPYGDYDTNHSSLFFPVSNEDSRLQRKVRVLGLLTGANPVAFEVRKFGPTTRLIEQTYGNTDYLIIGNSDKNFAVSYQRSLKSGKELKDSNGADLTFGATDSNLPVILESSDGTKWNIFGVAVEGPLQGEELRITRSYIAFWFAWAAFFPDTEIN